VLKDPNAKLPFTMDWSAWLLAENDTALSAAWTVPTGLVRESSPAESLVDDKATIWLSGGTAGVIYEVMCRLTTVGGRVDDRTLQIRIQER